MSTKLDAAGYHVPMQFLESWPLPTEYVAALKAHGNRDDEGYLHVPLEHYDTIRAKYFPDSTSMRHVSRAEPNLLLPGSLLTRVISVITGEKSIGCGMCSEHAKLMNKKGWWWCWRNRETILQWLVEAAQKRGHVIDKQKIRGLLRAAFKERF